MATKPPSALKEFEQQLTCPVCLYMCIFILILRAYLVFILFANIFWRVYLLIFKEMNISSNVCLTCRTFTELPEPTGPAAFPVAFHINNLNEVYSLCKFAILYNLCKFTILSAIQSMSHCEICSTTITFGWQLKQWFSIPQSKAISKFIRC